MKKHLLHLLLSVLCASLLLFSCNTEEKKTGNYFKGKQLKGNSFEKEITVEPKKVSISEKEIAGMWLIYHIDSMVLAGYHNTGFFYKLFDDMENRNGSVVLHEGGGPNEFISVSYCDYYHKNENSDYIAYFSDPNLGKIVSVNLSEYKRSGKHKLEKVSTYPNSSCFIPKVLSDKKVIYQDYRQLEKKHYLLLKELHTDKLIKEIELSDEKFVYPFANISFAQCSNKKASKLALACAFMNQIVIVDLDEDEKVIFSTDKELLQWTSIIESTKAYMYEPKRYCDVKNINNHIVANYIGNGEYSEFHVLDWNGKGIAKINTPILFRYFDYNKIDNHIYALTEDEELYKFDLIGII